MVWLNLSVKNSISLAYILVMNSTAYFGLWLQLHILLILLINQSNQYSVLNSYGVDVYRFLCEYINCVKNSTGNFFQWSIYAL